MTENIYMSSIDNISLVSLISSTIERFISSSSSHQAHLKKPVRRNFKRAKVIVSGPNQQLDVDLADMRQSLSKDNEGMKYLLVAIDVFSRYAWVEPLKNKTAKEDER
jgi:malonyl CoA-acyl carrier protein transacylase